MTPLSKHLDRLKALRREHSQEFVDLKFENMQRVSDKIRRAWEDYDAAREAAFMARVCFNCAGTPVSKFTVEASGKVPMLFCSENCRLAFGVSLGLT